MISSSNDVCQVSKWNFQGLPFYNFAGGRIFHFPIDFWMGLTTVQRYCAACDTVPEHVTQLVQRSDDSRLPSSACGNFAVRRTRLWLADNAFSVDKTAIITVLKLCVHIYLNGNALRVTQNLQKGHRKVTWSIVTVCAYKTCCRNVHVAFLSTVYNLLSSCLLLKLDQGHWACNVNLYCYELYACVQKIGSV